MTKKTEASTTCVVYCRVSSPKQAKEDKASLDAQERNGLAKAQELGLTVLYVKRDAESAWVLDKRSEFQRVLDDARAGKFGVLIVDRMNRFTRSEDLSEYMEVVTVLKKAGVELVCTDKDYGGGRAADLMRFLDAWQSAGDQELRRKQSLVGKQARVYKMGHPNPGSWPLYGYVWVDDKKTCLDFDPGQSKAIVERIWHYFLTTEAPTLAGMAKALNREGVSTPREYRNIKRGSNALATGPRWTAVTIGDILKNPVYWGGDENGMVPMFRYSEQSEQTLVPAYAPAYVTRDEADRVHALLAANQRYSYRNRKRMPNTMLFGGLARCGYCGWALASYTYRRPRADGSLLTVYRCQQSALHGTHDCKGVVISADVLDDAVLYTLDSKINKGHFLDKMVEMLEHDATDATGKVQTLEQTLKKTQQDSQNLVARIATMAPGDPLAAPLEAHARMLAETIPGLQQRHDAALDALNRVRANPELVRSLKVWFDGWLEGVPSVPTSTLREFLKAIKAEVRVWRDDDRQPHAQLVIALPTSAMRLPQPPTSDEDMQVDVDLEAGRELATIARRLKVDRVAEYN